MKFLYSSYELLPESKRILEEWLAENKKIIKDTKYLHHCTIEYGQDSYIPDVIIDRVSDLIILGYIEDESCSAFIVDACLSRNNCPHITISCKEDIGPVYSNYLCAQRFKIEWITPIIIKTKISKVYEK